ncbi:MAG: LysR family transcriptional regulator [Dermatophilaceae bacterium]
MSLGGSDLNLLVALRVLLEEGNVTRAGRRLDMSQPAMSGALTRLRRHFRDELLVRNGRDFELTPFARELLPEVQEASRLMRAALQLDVAFDPRTSERTFRLTMSDYALSVVHAPLLHRVRERAPGVRLEVEPLGPDVRESERVLIDHDVLVGPLGYGFPGVSRPFFRDRMVCLVDGRNSRLRGGRLTLDDLGALPHAVASFGGYNLTPADRVLGELGIDRKAKVVVSGYLPLPHVIEGTDMVAVLPERLARRHTGWGGLVTVEPPFGEAVLAEGYWYAAHHEADPAYRWLFARLDEVADALAV